MRLYISIRQHRWISILCLLFLFPIILEAQKFADKSYYIIDSLILEELVDSDKHLLDSALSLYHEAINDTARFNAIYMLTQANLL